MSKVLSSIRYMEVGCNQTGIKTAVRLLKRDTKKLSVWIEDADGGPNNTHEFDLAVTGVGPEDNEGDFRLVGEPIKGLSYKCYDVECFSFVRMYLVVLQGSGSKVNILFNEHP